MGRLTRYESCHVPLRSHFFPSLRLRVGGSAASCLAPDSMSRRGGTIFFVSGLLLLAWLWLPSGSSRCSACEEELLHLRQELTRLKQETKVELARLQAEKPACP
eukprot:1353530-Prymnesium_polylepis.1